MISVIIPVYNVEKYLRAAIDSVINQTYTDLEIILVEDKSTDGSPAILKEYEKLDSRIRVIYHEENKGLSGARNTGIKAATGSHLYFMDSDDCIHPETLEKMIKACRDDVQVVIGSYVEYFGDGDPIEDLEYYAENDEENITSTHKENPISVETDDSASDEYEEDPRGDLFELFDDENFNWTDLNTIDKPARYYSGRDFLISASTDPDSKMFIDSITAWGILVTREAFGGLMFPQGRLHEDEFTTYKLIYHRGKVAYIEAPFYFYRRREASITYRENLWSRWDAIDALDEKLDYFREENDGHMAMKTMERLLIKLIQVFRYSREDNLSKETIDKARKYYKRIYREDFKSLIRDKSSRKALSNRNRIKFGLFYRFRPIYMVMWKLKDSIRGTK